VTRLSARWSWVPIPAVAKVFLFTKTSRLALGSTQPPIEQVLAVPSPRVKQSRCKADHSPQFNAKIKNGWVYISTLLLCLHGVQLYLPLKHCYDTDQVKCVYCNKTVNNSTKMGKQKYIEKFPILCILIYQSLLQYSNYTHIVYLIHIFFTESLIHVLVS
jgi:hypothetical protein